MNDSFPSQFFGVLDNRFLSQSVGLLEPPEPIVAYEDEPVKRALQILKENKIGCVVVVGQDDTLKGIFSERDVLLKLVLEDVDINDTLMRDIMTKNPQSVEPTSSVAFALNLMSEGGFRHLPIVDEENIPVGIFSCKDIIDFISKGLTKDLLKTAI